MWNSRALGATMAGAVIGGLAGYLFFSEHGRRMRRSLEPVLDDLARELVSFRGTVHRAATVASEGWKLLNDAIDDAGAPVRRFPSTHQTSPF
jgi:hypothetical protein